MVKTRATPDGEGWRINGRKIWTTNSPQADWCIVFAVTDPDLGRKLGEQGYAALHQRWTADVHIPRYLSLVKGVLEARNARVDEAHSPSPVAQG